MKKAICTLLAGTACAATAALPFSAQASEIASTSTYTHSAQPERYAVSAEEAASGDVCIPIATYLKGKTGSDISVLSAQSQLVSDSSNLYFRNVYNPMDTYTLTEYSYLGGTFSTSYRPFCFGTVSDGVYSTRTINAETRDFCMNPITGTLIYYNGVDADGNETITFKLAGRYYVDETGAVAQDSQSHDIVCALTQNEDGSATYTFSYANIFGQQVTPATITGVIPYFQPELLSVGDKIPSYSDLICWIGSVTTTSTFLGNSDDFPLLETNLYLKAGTPCGIYNITLDQDYCEVSISQNDTFFRLPLRYEDTAIAVGVQQATATDSTAPAYACYYAENTKTITANSMDAQYTCDVAFEDGTQQTLDVTNAVNAGISPSALWAQSSLSYFNGTVPMYCGDTEIATSETDDTPITQNVLVGLKGDVNLDGVVSIEDASTILRYYASVAAGLDVSLTDDPESPEETLAYFLGDIDTQSQTKENGGSLSIDDASAILKYYASTAAGITLSWDEFL